LHALSSQLNKMKKVMKKTPNKNEKAGLYLGTEIEEKWWKRYKKDKLFARGNGKYWIDDQAFYFLRYFTKVPITIPFKNIIECKTGKWHSGKWGFGYPILKILWLKEDVTLSSGFLIHKNNEKIMDFIATLEKQISLSS